MKLKKEVIGVGVGRNTHTVVKGEEEIYIPNSQKGIDVLLKLISQGGRIVFAGNKRWASPLAYSLNGSNLEIFYLPLKTDPNIRGARGSMAKLLKKSFEQGIYGSFFFSEKPPISEVEPEAKIYKLAVGYDQASNEVRRAKHRILNSVAILFPEAVKVKLDPRKKDLPLPSPQPSSDIFTKKMRKVLEDPFPEHLEADDQLPAEIPLLAKNSLAKSIPLEIRQKEADNLQEALDQYEDWLEIKKERISELRNLVKNHPLFQDFGEGDLSALIIGFLGWRNWPNWRELRAFCGLAVGRIDSKGKPRITRKRPNIRKYLYLLAGRTEKGREVSQNIGQVEDEEIRRRKLRRVKRLERLLKALWREYFK